MKVYVEKSIQLTMLVKLLYQENIKYIYIGSLWFMHIIYKSCRKEFFFKSCKPFSRIFINILRGKKYFYINININIRKIHV